MSFRFSSISNSPDKLILAELYKLFKHDAETIILVRPHPGDDFSQTILDRICPEENFLCSTTSLFEDITLCDIVIQSPISTVGTEAAIFEKPVFFVDVLDENVSESMNPVYHTLLESKVVKLIHKTEIKSIISSIEKGVLWNKDSTERTKFLSEFFNLDKKINLFNLIFSERST